MRDLKNKVQLIGNLGAVPTVKELENGTKIAKLSIATDDFYKNAEGESIKETQWHRLVAFGKVAENMAKFLHKGSEVFVMGKLTHRTYQDKANQTRYVTEIIVKQFMPIAKQELAPNLFNKDVA